MLLRQKQLDFIKTLKCHVNEKMNNFWANAILYTEETVITDTSDLIFLVLVIVIPCDNFKCSNIYTEFQTEYVEQLLCISFI